MGTEIVANAGEMVRSKRLPPRRRVRWTLWCLSVIFLGIPLTHGIIYWHFAQSLQSRIDALHAAGEKVEPSDFSEQIDPDDNAAKDVAAAAAIFDDNSIHAQSIDGLPTTRPIPAKAWPYLNAAVDWFKPALVRVDRAMTESRCEWDHSFQSPMRKNLLLRELSQCRNVANLVNASSLVEHRRQRDDVAVRRIQQLLFLSNACEHSPSIGHMVASGIIAMAASRIEGLAPALRVGDAQNGAAPASELRKLISTLVDESNFREGLKYQFATQRMQDLDDYRSLLDDDSAHPVGDYIFGPILDHDAILSLDQMTEFSNAALASTDWTGANERLSKIPQPRWWVMDLEPQVHLRFQIRQHFQALTDRRLAATALAIRLFCNDHQGRFPPALDDLVPNYLPAVPLDPMAANRRRMSYLPRSQNPVLYSVGMNGADDDGSEAATPGEHGELNEWRRLDRVFYLTSRPLDYLFVPSPNSIGQNYPLDDLQNAPWDRNPPPPIN